jgi:ferredoxin-nitrite reductase
VADIGLLGKKMRRGNEVIEAVDIYMGGRTGIDPKLAVKVMEDVPCDQLAQVLELVVPYHTREKMHPIKGKKYARRREPSLPVKPKKENRKQYERSKNLVLAMD